MQPQIKNKLHFMNYKILTATLLCCLFTTVTKAQEPYWIQTFEDTIPASKDTETALKYQIEGQGEWIFYKSFKGTNTSYIKDGSKGCLRIPKSKNAYVVTPVVDKGVGRITFDEGRSKRSLLVYASTDAGQTWTLVKEFKKSTTANNTVSINDANVNRVKLEKQDSSGDCDVDNLTLYPYDPNITGGGDNPTVDNGVVETFWCSPEGSDDNGDGTQEKPFYSLQKAVDLAGPADTILMLAGTYLYDARVNIPNCGSAEKHITLKCPNGRAVLDFSKMPYHKHSDNPQQGIRLTGSYWHFYHIDICNASDNGLLIERESTQGYPDYQAHDNLIEQCDFYKNGDTGLQMKNAASFNYVVNCDSYLNCDEGQGDADGFAPKISVGDGNYFYGCRAWLNSDDGWDVFYKKDSGQADNVSVILENCISYKNGFLDENTIAEDGNGNGFKMGSNQGAMNMFMNRCVALCNKAKGFDQNHNAGDIIMNNCTGMTLTSIDSKTYSYRIYEEIATGHEVRLTNCIAINDNDATDKRDKQGNIKPSEHGKYGQYGRFEVDETLDGMHITTCEFQKADPTQFLNVSNHADVMAPRDENGEIPYSTFARLVEGSSLIDKGTLIDATTYRGISVADISYNGSAPDLGAYESNYGASSIGAIKQTSQGTLHLRQTESGLVILTLDAAPTTDAYQASFFDLSGRWLGQHAFVGNCTMLRLPHSTSIISVKGNNYHATAKVAGR